MTGFNSKRQMAADKLHWSDCAVHNGPAYPAGECDCGAAQEPVTWTLLLIGEHHGIIGKAGEQFLGHPKHYERVDVYTTPPKREWVGLTDEEIHGTPWYNETHKTYQFALSLIAKLKERNS
jgi:hypothetical protein